MVLCVCALSDFLLSFKNWLTSFFLESDHLRQLTDFLFPLLQPRVLLTPKPQDHNGIFVNLWPENVQWLLSPQSLTQGELMAAVTPEFDAGGAHECRMHWACGAERQGWLDTGRDYTFAESVITVMREFTELCLWRRRGPGLEVQTPSCPTASGKPTG